MVALNSQSERNLIGIDTLERALVYSFIMLRTAIIGSENQGVADQRIKIGENIQNIENATIALEGQLKYDAFSTNKFGGNVILNLEELPGTTPYSLDINCPPSANVNPIIPDTPKELTSLEQYIYWSAASLLASLPLDQKNITIAKFEHNKDGAYIQIKASLPFNYKAYLLGKNYICTVNRITDNYAVFRFPNDTIIENDTFISNSLLFAN
ncbi:MAG: hypothetical protein AB4372_10095 [Xenococcus sp. (in: cyanobacteria)]